MVALLLACAHPRASAVPTRAEIAAPPRLPSPRGKLYVRGGETRPSDPLLARVMTASEARWDEALSGAATGVALAVLGGDVPDDASTRWQAVLAGYPYALLGRAVVRAPRGQVPDAIQVALAAEGLPGRDVGLVRARGAQEDVWVLLMAAPHADIGEVPREVATGASVPLAAGVAWRASGPSGAVESLDGGVFVPDAPGAWLLQALDARGPVATLPIYVDMPTPEQAPLRTVPSAPTTEERVISALAALHGPDAPAADPALGSIARARLRAWNEDGSLPPAERQLEAAGFLGGGAAGACRAATLEACLHAMWWSPQDRGALLAGWPSVGVAASVSTDAHLDPVHGVVSAGQVSVVVVAAR